MTSPLISKDCASPQASKRPAPGPAPTPSRAAFLEPATRQQVALGLHRPDPTGRPAPPPQVPSERCRSSSTRLLLGVRVQTLPTVPGSRRPRGRSKRPRPGCAVSPESPGAPTGSPPSGQLPRPSEPTARGSPRLEETRTCVCAPARGPRRKDGRTGLRAAADPRASRPRPAGTLQGGARRADIRWPHLGCQVRRAACVGTTGPGQVPPPSPPRPRSTGINNADGPGACARSRQGSPAGAAGVPSRPDRPHLVPLPPLAGDGFLRAGSAAAAGADSAARPGPPNTCAAGPRGWPQVRRLPAPFLLQVSAPPAGLPDPPTRPSYP